MCADRSISSDADDITLTSSAEDLYALKHKMNYDMNVIQSLLTANKLALNVKKTKHILIGSKFKLYYPKYRITLQLKSITHHKKLLAFTLTISIGART